MNTDFLADNCELTTANCSSADSFPDGRSAVMLAAARLRYVSGSRWGTRRYLDMNRLKEMQEVESATADDAVA